MPDPHGWGEQAGRIQAHQRAGAAREQERLTAAAASVAAGQVEGGGKAPPVPGPEWDGQYWAVLAWCRTHDRWGLSFAQPGSNRAFYEAYSAASGHGDSEQWCKDLRVLTHAADSRSSGACLMVRRGADGSLKWDKGRSARSVEKRLRREFGGDSDLLLLVSVRDGVVVNDGLRLIVGWAPGMRGAQ